MGGGEFDIVVFGASGFLGTYVVEEVAKCSRRQNLKFAIAGRNHTKLKLSLTRIQEYVSGFDATSVPVIVADASDAISIDQMCKRTKLVINCVIQFKIHGEAVVKACIAHGTHLVDAAAEVEYLVMTQAKYFHEARQRNIFVVQACGFGSLPNDFGITLMKRHFNGELTDVEAYFVLPTSFEGFVVHSGTWTCTVDSLSDVLTGYSKYKEALKSVFGEKLPEIKYPQRKRSLMFYSTLVHSWCLWFMEPDRGVIQRTQNFNYHFIGEKPVQAKIYACTKSIFQALLIAFIALCLVTFSSFSLGRSLLKKYPSFFTFGYFSSEGPTRKQVEKASTKITLFGRGFTRDSERKVKKEILEITGPEPGYALTSICMVQAALVILDETERLPLGGGILTPGAAFADTTLRERLAKRGVKFTFVDNDKTIKSSNSVEIAKQKS